MGKVGRRIDDPKTGSYVPITLDSGEKIEVAHNKGGFKGGMLTIQVLKFGFGSDRILSCDLDREEGRNAITLLIRDASQTSIEVTPLGALVEYVKDCKSVDDVQAKCAALMSGH